jgi:hypothetical protein
MRACLSAAWVLAGMAACYSGKPPSGAPCSPQGACPRGQECVGDVCLAEGDPRPDATEPVETPVTIIVGKGDGELEDTALSGEMPDTNVGDEDHFSVDADERGLVRFRFSSAPAGMRVVRAVLTFHTFDQVDGPYGTVLVIPMLQPWDEHQSTWNNQRPGTPWNEGPGAGPFPGERAVGQFEPLHINTAYEVELSAELVQRWIDDPDQNFGLAVVPGTSVGHIHIATHDRHDVEAWTTLEVKLEPR